MIGKLKGKLVEVENNVGLIETAGGVSYQVHLPSFLTANLQLPAPVEIYTYLQVREDALILFGFSTKTHLNFFKMLLSVPNIGPKTAFNVVCFSDIDKLITAVKENNIDFFNQIPGLGKKTAMKIILELSQKLKTEFEFDKMYLTEDDKMVVDALVSLGFKTFEAKKVIFQIPKNLSVEERIKKALKMIK
ncbi:MAG: Holliday junction branch migration protein RuvA [Microgenomates group bacterium]